MARGQHLETEWSGWVFDEVAFRLRPRARGGISRRRAGERVLQAVSSKYKNPEAGLSLEQKENLGVAVRE